jgi:8-oxo-dGTP pyrophosphatase MutT (NUDIX family)
VFPGGAVEAQDHLLIEESMNKAVVKDALSDHQAWGIDDQRDAARSLGAALRETEEESGLSVAMLISEAQSLRCVGHWLTPEALKTRFDAYFWAAELSGERALATLNVDGVEIERGEWLNPSDVLRAYEHAEIDLPAPTLCIISELAELIEQVSKRQSSIVEPERQITLISELIMTLNQAAHVHPICPVLDKTQGVRLYLPGDLNYAHKRGDEPRVGSTSFWCTGPHYLERVASNPLNDKSPSIWRRIT